MESGNTCLCFLNNRYEFPGDFSKRVYQGVRVKHTVKDLLAEKRSRQTSNSRFNGSVSSSPSPFAQMPGSPALSGYYGVRRSFLSDSDFPNGKPFPNDGYSPGVAKSFPCEAAAPSHTALLEPCFPEPYGDFRGPGLGPGASLLGASPLLPPFPADPAHLVFVSRTGPGAGGRAHLPGDGPAQSNCNTEDPEAGHTFVNTVVVRGEAPQPRDSWEQTVPDGLNQPESLPAEALQTLPPSTNCFSQLESGSASLHRSSSWAPALPAAHSYSLHALEELHHPPGYPTPPPYPFAPFMAMPNDLPSKATPLAPDEGADTSLLPDPSPWTKEEGSTAWGAYECRRPY